MKKAFLFMACLMILLCVSCRSEALELVNVYLDSPVSKTTWAATSTLNTDNLFYRATALSEGRTYGSTENYTRYNSGDPLTLTQGLWLIEVVSFNNSSAVPSFCQCHL